MKRSEAEPTYEGLKDIEGINLGFFQDFFPREEPDSDYESNAENGSNPSVTKFNEISNTKNK